MKIPSNNLWTQTNEGKKLGILSDSFNLNLETPGQLLGSKKSAALLHQDAHNQLNNILAILYYNDSYIAVTPDEAYVFSLNTTNTTTIASFPSGVSNNSDAVICFNRMYVTLNTNLAYWNGSSWTTGIESLTADVPHPMDIFDSLPTYKLAIGNGNSVILVDSSGNKSSTELTLPAQFRVTTVRYRNGFLYIGTRNIYGGEARVFIWNGSGASAQYEVPVGASWVFSMVPYKSSVAVVDNKGQLQYVDGTSMTELSSFPIRYEKNAVWQSEGGNQFNGKVFLRGMEVIGDSIYINIDGDVDNGFCNKMKSGLWIYNPEVGLYHYAQASSDRVRQDNGYTISNSEITLSATHYIKTGDGIVFTEIVSMSGVSDEKTYYAYVTDTNKIKISETREALHQQIFVECSGTGTLLYVENRDFGDNTHSSGAVGRITAQQTTPTIFAGEVLFGALTSNIDGTSRYTLQILCDSYNVSRFATQRIYSDNIKQSWKEVYAFIDGVRLSNEEFILKYNTKPKENRRVINGAWLNANTINCSAVGQDVTTLSIGDEVVITDGYGRGYSTFITNKSNSSTIYSFVVADALGTATESVSFYSTPARKQTTFTSARQDESYLSTTLKDVSSTWISLKGEMRGFQTEVAHLELSNAVKKGSK